MHRGKFSLSGSWNVPRWDFYSGVIFLAVVMFQAFSWFRFPLFLDGYYHLSVVQGFRDAGGWVGHAFWEYAPFGRPHVYPPLLHILQLVLYRAGLDLISVARLSDVLIYPWFLYCGWSVIRRALGSLAAFWFLFFALSATSLCTAVINNIPFSLAFGLGLLCYGAVMQNRPLRACVLLTLAFYAHSLVPWLFLAALLLYTIPERQKRQMIWRIAAATLIPSFPILYHQARYLAYVRLVKPPDFYYLAIPTVLTLFVVAGVVFAWRRKKDCQFFMILASVMFSLFWTHRSRLISGQGLFLWCFYAALAVNEIVTRFLAKAPRVYQATAMAVMVLVFQVFGFQYNWSPKPEERSWKICETPAMIWMGLDANDPGVKATTIYYPKWIGQCVWMVKELSSERQIIFSNYDYAGGMVAVLSHRATSTAMLAEVRPFRDFDPVAYAHAVLWFKDVDGEGLRYLSLAAARYGLQVAGETQIAYLLVNPSAVCQERVIPATVPFWACLVFLVLAFAGLLVPEDKVGFLGRKKC
ncbi:hypothetical protein BU251_05360 [Candidatus Velamenicoccus archaeovorus]|uniref:Membrane protein 6-pyruvoyl-tetrahydropterin synthase-related domain-containing protein n=1 Tax=Velamenicoccus archaeovorus TaxID=1930593 RepID=A0A410P538_VELA1|nr:hypothetical protein [Candidatus Velamenicoccus archaeovorus]QAT17198.1 hypothetical protein BU251_05360 [Candidatus Velamenicoccus archaeovorus]